MRTITGSSTGSEMLASYRPSECMQVLIPASRRFRRRDSRYVAIYADRHDACRIFDEWEDRSAALRRLGKDGWIKRRGSHAARGLCRP